MKQKRKAAEFKRKYSLKTINSADLWEALTAQGYTLVEFNSIKNKENVISDRRITAGGSDSAK